MNVRNCRKCGRVFNYIIGQTLCLSCRDALEGKFKEVKEYVQKNRGCGINDVAEACDVDSSQIRQWIREERLEFTEDSMIGLACEICGSSIRTGRYCDKCKAQTLNGLNNVVRQAQASRQQQQTTSTNPKDNPRMRFL